jgi:hypothetical protein
MSPTQLVLASADHIAFMMNNGTIMLASVASSRRHQRQRTGARAIAMRGGRVLRLTDDMCEVGLTSDEVLTLKRGLSGGDRVGFRLGTILQNFIKPLFYPGAYVVLGNASHLRRLLHGVSAGMDRQVLG